MKIDRGIVGGLAFLLNMAGPMILTGCSVVATCTAMLAMPVVYREFSLNKAQLTAGLVGIVVAGSGALIAITVGRSVSLSRRKRLLDSLLVSLGFVQQTTPIAASQYHVRIKGRTVRASFFRGSILHLHVAVTSPGRVYLAPATVLSRLLKRSQGLHELRVDDPALAWLEIVSHDDTWTRSFLSSARDWLIRLTSYLEPHVSRLFQLAIEPTAVLLQLYDVNLKTISLEKLRELLDDLIYIAEIVEQLPPPSTPLPDVRQDRLKALDRTTLIGVLAPLMFMVMGGLCVLLMCVILIILAQPG